MMDRLTKRDEHGYVCLGFRLSTVHPLHDIASKLCAYEDIGSVSQFAEWAQAEKEGRSIANGFAITNKDGTRIDYAELGTKYKDQLVYCDIDGFYIGEDGQLVLMDDCGNSVCVDSDDYRITANFEAAKGE